MTIDPRMLSEISNRWSRDLVTTSFDESEEIVWSASKLDCVMSCGMKAKLRYVDHEEGVRSLDQMFGNVIHKMIENLHFKLEDWVALSDFTGEPVWETEWLSLWEEYFAGFDWKAVKPMQWAMKRSGYNIIKRYVHQYQEADVIGCEIPFDDLMIGPFKFRGKIDRMQRLPNGRLLLADMKTSKLPMDPLVLRVSPQFTIYDQYAKVVLGEEPVLVLHHLKSGELFPTVRTPDDLPILIEMLSEAKSRMDRKQFSRNMGYQCTYCEFKQSCLGPFLNPELLRTVEDEP